MILRNLKGIAKYMGVHPNTVVNHIKYHGFPATKLPGGHWITSESLIDKWIMARRQIMIDNGSYPKNPYDDKIENDEVNSPT